MASQSPITYRENPAEWYAGRCVPGILGNKAARPRCPLGASSAFTAAEGRGLRQRVFQPRGASLVLYRDRRRARGAAGLHWEPPGPAVRSCLYPPPPLKIVRWSPTPSGCWSEVSLFEKSGAAQVKTPSQTAAFQSLARRQSPPPSPQGGAPQKHSRPREAKLPLWSL